MVFQLKRAASLVTPQEAREDARRERKLAESRARAASTAQEPAPTGAAMPQTHQELKAKTSVRWKHRGDVGIKAAETR